MRFNSQFNVEFKKIKKHVNDLKIQNEKLKIKHESNKSRYESNKFRHQSNKLQFAKLHKVYKKTCEKIKKLKIIVENQQKKSKGL